MLSFFVFTLKKHIIINASFGSTKPDPQQAMYFSTTGSDNNKIKGTTFCPNFFCFYRHNDCFFKAIWFGMEKEYEIMFIYYIYLGKTLSHSQFNYIWLPQCNIIKMNWRCVGVSITTQQTTSTCENIIWVGFFFW